MRVFFQFNEMVVDGEILDLSLNGDCLVINARPIRTGAVVSEDSDNLFIECCDFIKVFGVCEDETNISLYIRYVDKI